MLTYSIVITASKENCYMLLASLMSYIVIFNADTLLKSLDIYSDGF
jgi:hypothetical protein